MSEENVPKLRLKPKLAAAPVDAPLPPAIVPPAAEAVPPSSVPPEAKAVRLKPKLAALSPQSVAPPAAPDVVPSPVEPLSPPSGFPPPEGAELEKPAVKFALRPKVVVVADPQATIPPSFPSPLPPTTESGSQSPIPPPDYVDPERPNEPQVVPGSLTSRPFPPPPVNFPPPAGGDKPAPPWAHPRTTAGAPKKKNLVVMGGGALVVLAVLGGAFFAYKKFTAGPAKSPETSQAAATRKEPDAVTPPHEETKPVTAIVAEAPPAVPAPEIAPVEVAPPPPPPPSAAFKAWVDALRIGGVRGGSATRVFIGGTAYAPGEVVNSQLGVVFDSYNAETRHVIFKDKTGATVSRRN